MLNHLNVHRTDTTAAEGRSFLEALQSLTTLETLDLSSHAKWFSEDYGQNSVDLLASIVTNQANLAKLYLGGHTLNDSQQSQIRAAVTNPECKIKF